jgi:hypothetical protein
MKKLFIMIFAGVMFLLGGCSLLNDAKNTLTYINEATDYLNYATNFANEAPALAQKAVSDQQAAKDLETMLQEMKEEINAFNALEAPKLATELHQQLVDKNNIISQGIDTYLNHFDDGKLDPAVLENTEIFQTVQEISSIIDQIKKLGN